jgi:two-component system, NtrC family, sensor kinase
MVAAPTSQAREPPSVGEGTGLGPGLSLSHDIVVKLHNGALEVATEPGEYTQFTNLDLRASPRLDAAREADGG